MAIRVSVSAVYNAAVVFREWFVLLKRGVMRLAKKKVDGLDVLLEERCREDLQRVLESESGRRFLWYLMHRAHVFRSSFTGNSETFFREGERSMGLFVLAGVLDVSPWIFGKMQKEFALWLEELEAEMKNEEAYQ